MFNDKQYIEVNREERFFCALLAHALLASPSVRRRFSDLVQSNVAFALDPDDLQVFLEAAALRDYWYDLGDPLSYREETHRRRKAVVEAILEDKNLPPRTMELEFFWTPPARKRLWNPGRWSLAAIKREGLEEQLKGVKWAFNAKPGILLMSGRNVLIIEAKVESGEGRNSGTGYSQRETQLEIAHLLKVLVPPFRDSTFKNITLTLDPQSDLTWLDISALCDAADLDKFSKRALEQLRKLHERQAEER